MNMSIITGSAMVLPGYALMARHCNACPYSATDSLGLHILFMNSTAYDRSHV